MRDDLAGGGTEKTVAVIKHGTLDLAPDYGLLEQYFIVKAESILYGRQQVLLGFDLAYSYG